MTETGHEVLAAYRALEADAARLADGDAYRRLTRGLRDAPLAARSGSPPA